ncbi:RNA methyltransferase [Rubrivivax albus]|uniref:RNA methyltransferase n=1 Tax=Rubrivivax albus TaxID=2499835 RepID=A0A3S2USG4_9BURK|nr:RNA methyltransferase [Rubrivivax albus]RVT54044.1 RNA methyltransferase [Rubrivivax albus]
MRIHDIENRLRALGAGPGHAARVLRHWVQARPQDAGRRAIADFLPKTLRAALPALGSELAALARLRERHPGADGSARLLVDLADGQTVETVLLPRQGVCVSTQLGCAVGCGFCMTGRSGLLRQLGSAEIVAQVALARSLQPVRKVVFMGMGEPAHNLDNVLEAIDLLGTQGNLAHKQLVFSTVGDARAFERLPQGVVKPALALSLHSMNAERRAALLPRAPRWEPADLLAEALAYARATGYPLQVQWTLLAGVNDGDDELEALVPALQGQPAILNMIPYNAVDGLDFRRPDVDRVTAIFRGLNQRGVLTRMRQSAGQDVDAGCGQLRARVVQVRRAAAPA